MTPKKQGKKTDPERDIPQDNWPVSLASQCHEKEEKLSERIFF